MKKWEKYLDAIEVIIAGVPIVTALILGFLGEADAKSDSLIRASFTLLTLMSVSLFMEQLIQKRRWEKMQLQFLTKMDSLSDGSIRIYDDTVDWISAIEDLISAKGQHTIHHVSLDSVVRGRASRQKSRVLEHILSVSRDKNIAYQHIVRIRHNNLEDVLDRVLAGGDDSNSIYSYFRLPDEFPFCTFEIIDNEYVATRSPSATGKIPRYLIIHNDTLVQYFAAYFQELWHKSTMINSYNQFLEFYEEFLGKYSNEERNSIQEKIDKLKKTRILEND